MPSLRSPEPTVNCFDDLDFFKDFENEYPAIVYNNAPTSKSDLLTEPTLNPQHIDEFDLKDETSLSEYDKKKQNGYTEEIVHDFEQRLDTIYGRQVNRVHILDFEGLTPDMRQDLAERMRMVYTGDDRQELGGARRSMTWRQFILAMVLHTIVEMAKDGFGAYWDFLRGAPSYTYIRDPIRRLCHRHAEGRKSSARLSGGHFIRRLAHHFGLVSDDGLRGLYVVARELPLIDIERQQVVAAGAVGDAPGIDEGVQADPSPIHAPQQPPLAARTMPQRMARIEEDVHEIRRELIEQCEVIDAMAIDFSRFTIWGASGIA
ncbi:hypothetical protein Tco_1140144 [Tanacetum coccineum]